MNKINKKQCIEALEEALSAANGLASQKEEDDALLAATILFMALTAVYALQKCQEDCDIIGQEMQFVQTVSDLLDADIDNLTAAMDKHLEELGIADIPEECKVLLKKIYDTLSSICK